ncbi:LnmK family bifunctional acyltransferase/decarboxylase [Streptomyces sp. NPDC001139]
MRIPTTTARSPELLADGSLVRRVTVQPGMCGHNSLLIGQLGDWTWETVGEMCATNTFAARNTDGDPTYLAFYYIHVQGSPGLHPLTLSIGDEIEVTSKVFGFGSESVLTLHRIGYHDGSPPRPVDPEEFYRSPRADYLYIENFNRWVARRDVKSNQNLFSSSPAGFQHTHLPQLAAEFSPRAVYGPVQQTGSFHPGGVPGYEVTVQEFTTSYDIDLNRDINGVGLVYFASYFSIINTALLRLWRQQERSEAAYLSRQVVDHKLLFLGNADYDTTLRITLRVYARQGDPADEIVEATVCDQESGRTLAVAALHVLRDPA